MLDTKKNIEETNAFWEEVDKELGITEDDVNDPKFDYMDED